MVNTLSGSVSAYRKEIVKPRFIRIDKKIAAVDLAAVLDIQSNQMSRIENGRANCTVPQLYVISQILGCSVDYLLFGKQCLTISQEQADSIKVLIETFTK